MDDLCIVTLMPTLGSSLYPSEVVKVSGNSSLKCFYEYEAV